MKHLIIFAHPNPASFGSALVKELYNSLLLKGDEAKIRNLYELGFNPTLAADDFEALADNCTPEDIKIEQQYILWADHLILVFPVWWGNMPAILKGYIDRVFSEGFAYKSTPNGDVGLLAPRLGSTVCTAGAPAEVYTGIRNAMNLISSEAIFNFTGITTNKQLFCGAVPGVTDEVRREYIENVKNEF